MAEEKPIFELGSKKLGVPISSGGFYMCAGPSDPPGIEEKQNSYSKLDFTGQPGTGSGLYYSLVFNLAKWGWEVEKADEWIEVSPTHKEYYDRTAATKQMLESTIKQGLISAAQTAADYELMSHDVRKYREILDYFKSKDENLLRSMFIDQVDIHTDLPGQPIALRTIVSRWPTIIADFQNLKESDEDYKEIAKNYDVSIAEAVILSTKNKLFKQWKKMFLETAKSRYTMLQGLLASRKKTITEYKEWLKPYIARFRMTRLGGERMMSRSNTLKTFVDITGISTFANGIRLYVWRPMKFAEHRKPLGEIKPIKDLKGGFVMNPYDDYVRDNIILNKDSGLVKIYPWLGKKLKYCKKCGKYYPEETQKCKKCNSLMLLDKVYADQVVNEQILTSWGPQKGLDPTELYYMFIDVDIFRSGTRLQVGELEDIIFTNKMFVLSQNIMLVKLLELWCRDRELENYIDEMLGVKMDDKSIDDIVREEFLELYESEKEKKEREKGLPNENEKKRIVRNMEMAKTMKEYAETISKIKKPFSGFTFLKHGPYERDFKDRVSKQYIKFASVQLGSITAFMKAKMGVE
jgi:hypothetical protein